MSTSRHHVPRHRLPTDVDTKPGAETDGRPGVGRRFFYAVIVALMLTVVLICASALGAWVAYEWLLR